MNCYKDKTILITGHTGFKGAWLALWLQHLGAEVIGYSLEPPSNPNLFDAIDLKKTVHHIEADIRDRDRLEMEFAAHSPHMVFHLAAQPLVRFSYLHPHLTFTTNVIGTVNVLEAIRKTESVRAAIIVTSDKCYKNKETGRAFTEDDPMGGKDPYSASKGCAELAVSAWRNSFFHPDKFAEHQTAVATARAGNVFGGGDWAEDRIIPDCVRALSGNRPIELRFPRSIRPWQFVLDPLWGYLKLGEKLCESGASKYGIGWNFAQEKYEEHTVEDLVKLFIKNWGSGEYILDSNAEQAPPEAGMLRLDNTKSCRELKWKPLYSLPEAIQLTVDWYKSFYKGKQVDELRQLCLEQITSYMSLTQT